MSQPVCPATKLREPPCRAAVVAVNKLICPQDPSSSNPEGYAARLSHEDEPHRSATSSCRVDTHGATAELAKLQSAHQGDANEALESCDKC